MEEAKYKSLLNKKLLFCIKNKDRILKEVNRIYKRQMDTGKVYFKHRDFKKLEAVADQF